MCGSASAAELALEFALERAAPNPATTTTTLAFTLPGDGNVRVGVFDVQGREVVRLVDGSLVAGRHFVEWGGDERALPGNGVYFVRCDWNGRSAAQRVIWVR